MNILQLVPKLNVGGVERGTVEEARFLVARGHKAVVVSGGGALLSQLEGYGVKHYTLPIGEKNVFAIFYSYNELKKIIRSENIQIVHARSRVPALIGYFASRACRAIFITTAHGQYKKHLISKAMGLGKFVIVASNMMANYMKTAFGVPLNKIVKIPRGIDTEKFLFRLPSDSRNRTFKVGMIARFTPIKGHLDFLKAVSLTAAKVPNFKAVIMGDVTLGKEDYIKKIYNSIKNLKLENIVEFKSSGEDVVNVLGGLDVLVSANREQEAFGRTIVEAQSRGVPVVATKVGGVIETVIDGVTGLLSEPCDAATLARNILRYYNEPLFARDIALNARKNVEENYALDKMLEDSLALYNKAISEQNILIFKISALGDVILIVPSLRAIRKKFPRAVIKVIIDVKYRKILEKCPYINELIVCDFNIRDKGVSFFRLASLLRSESFDISIDMQNNRKSRLLAFWAGIPSRYGFKNGKWNFLINFKAQNPRFPLGPIEHQEKLLGLLGITIQDKSLELWKDAESDKWAENFLGFNSLVKEGKLAGISLSASKKWKTKNWPLKLFLEFEKLLAKEGVRVVLIGLTDDLKIAEEFSSKTIEQPINAVGKTNISQLISLISKLDVLIAGDSSPIHIAAAVGTPFAAIFGPTQPERHMPPSSSVKSKLFYSKMKCSPCYKKRCFRKQKCMMDINPDKVFNAVMEIMK
ncbi:Lipopolysaccharide heptosyltransferase II [Candidatus Omnitrophus magneticus]|uniref:lipopolysaccharide heptosyltransferase II n=1 Tax=Candidatus Omnitrophus magneticus TaxID=1609969 RepID=A0A0F0CRS0_9BACT|nr:Lipopolysaccharide heptosyltransferase II [Candidatus Omnitrophus magneticus]